ncbi:MAG: NADH-quinone oxidoreductase subunit L [Marinoscillum sp.]|jgi:NADH-quinone oxidoreductase subunit L
MSALSYILLVGFAPLFGGLITYISGKKNALKVYWIGPVLTFCASGLLFNAVLNETLYLKWQWLPGMELGWAIDAMSGLLILLVSLISLLVHLFSAHYMADESQVHRYFGKLGFFSASMLGLLMSDHLVLVFIFWELVGFSSYLLIGYWFQDGDKARAAREAFMINRVADAGLLIGVILMVGVLDQPYLSSLATFQDTWIYQLAGLGLMIGAFGKSAQFPFYGWLPKAMAGPTPVSALIHAATMVTLGVYLLIRVQPVLTPFMLSTIAVVGAITALMAAISALTQFDIKKVLAYSTISQLGYMIMGIGVGASEASLFHLWTHAFFKAGLFLGAGAVIHYLHQAHHDDSFDAQDMRSMGGLKKHLPLTAVAFTICALALAGLPLFSGFLSKEGILTGAANWSLAGDSWRYLVPAFGLITAVLTPFYIGRQVLLVFHGKPRAERQTIVGMEPLIKVALPISILAIGSVWIFHSLNPFDASGWYFADLLPLNMIGNVTHGGAGFVVLILSLLAVVIGLFMAYSRYGEKKNTAEPQSFREPSTMIAKLSWNSWYVGRSYFMLSRGYLQLCHRLLWVDKRVIDGIVNSLGVITVVVSKVFAILDREVIDGVVNFAAWISRGVGGSFAKIQSGKVQNQLVWLIIMLLLLIIWIQF